MYPRMHINDRAMEVADDGVLWRPTARYELTGTDFIPPRRLIDGLHAAVFRMRPAETERAALATIVSDSSDQIGIEHAMARPPLLLW